MSVTKRLIHKVQTLNQGKKRWLYYAIVGSSSLVLLYIFFYLFLILGAFGHMPSKNEIRSVNNPTASEIYDNNDQLFGKYFIENRTNADYNEIPVKLFQALISTEDERFYSHSGVDLTSLFRVFFKTLIGGDKSSGGGSTITQQLAKNLYGRPNKGFLGMPLNKFREMIIAKRIEKVFSKNEILTLYLNTVSWGSDIYGVRVAARRYFSNAVSELNIEESATLVGMLKATTSYNPLRNQEGAKMRRNLVLNRMTKHGYLSERTQDSLSKLPIKVRETLESNNEGKATYFREFVRLQMDGILADIKKEDGSKYNIYTDGLKIFTTIDLTMQEIAEWAVADHMKYIQKEFDGVWKGGKPWRSDDYILDVIHRSERYNHLKSKGLSEDSIMRIFKSPIPMTIWDWKNGKRKVTMSPLDSIKHYAKIYRAGLLSVDSKNGYVKAWVGGVNHEFMKFDHVNSMRQVGSTIKPLVYLQALRHGYKPCDYFSNTYSPTPEWKDWKPENIHGEYGGSYNMPTALAKSLNLVTVNLAMQSNLDSMAMLINQLGISQKVPPYPAVALGAVEASLMEMVRAYKTISKRGMDQPITFIRRVEDKYGNTIIDNESKVDSGRRILSTFEADIMIKMLENVVDKGTAKIIRDIYRMDGEIAGKTGTSQHEADGWFIGFTPSLITGVWVGGEAPVIHFRYGSLGQGASSALPIWVKYNYKVSIHSKLKAFVRDSFVVPSDSIKQLLACAIPFLNGSMDQFSSLDDSTQMENQSLNLDSLKQIGGEKGSRDSSSKESQNKKEKQLESIIPKKPQLPDEQN